MPPDYSHNAVGIADIDNAVVVVAVVVVVAAVSVEVLRCESWL